MRDVSFFIRWRAAFRRIPIGATRVFQTNLSQRLSENALVELRFTNGIFVAGDRARCLGSTRREEQVTWLECE